MPDKNNKPKPTLGLDKHWHLSKTEHEVSITEIEFALFRAFSAFSRWMDDCAACCHDADHPCNGMDYALLNIIRMHQRPKSISEIARLMNRDDISNIQYSIRKLTKAKLIEKLGGSQHKRGATYTTTDSGEKVTDLYGQFRRELLLPLTSIFEHDEGQLDQVTKVLSLLSGIYDQAACVAASHRLS